MIVYATSTRYGLVAPMASDAVRELVDQVDCIVDGDEVDVLIHSTGGDALAAWKLMTVLRERFGRVSVLVPYMAFSAATLFALGADEICMHPHASLGPIDPQIPLTLPEGSLRWFSYEDVGAFLRFLGQEVRIQSEEYISAAVSTLFAAVDPVLLGGAARASELSTEVGERLLRMHMEGEAVKDARVIAENLNKSFFSHGDALSRSRAKELGLKVAPSDPDLERLMWQAYLGIEEYLELREPYNWLHQFLRCREAAESVRPVAPLQIPPNAPPEMVAHLWNSVAQNAIKRSAEGGVEVPCAVVSALMESTRLASEHRSTGTLAGRRLPDGAVQVGATERSSGWMRVDGRQAHRSSQRAPAQGTTKVGGESAGAAGPPKRRINILLRRRDRRS